MSEIILQNDPAVTKQPGFVDFYGLWSDYYDYTNSIEILEAIYTTQTEIAAKFYEGDIDKVVDTSKLALMAVKQVRHWASELTPEVFND